MAILKVTYNQKSHVIPYGTREVQIWDLDMNELKQVVNFNADGLEDLQTTQFTSFVAVQTYADLPAGVAGTGYYVLDDPNPNNNGMWGFDTAFYQANQTVNSGAFDPLNNVNPATQKSTNDQITDRVFIPKENDFPNEGLYLNGVFTDSINWRNGSIDCVAGQSVLYYAYGGSNSNPIVFLNESDVVIGSVLAAGANAWTYGIEVAPAGTVRAVISTLEGETSSSYYGASQELVYQDDLQAEVEARENQYNKYPIEGSVFSTPGLYLDDVWTESENWATAFVPLDEGMEINCYVYGTSDSNTYVFLNDNGDILGSDKITTAGGLYSRTAISPTGTTRVAFCTLNGEIPNSYYNYQSTVTELDNRVVVINESLQKAIDTIEIPKVTPINGKIITVSKTEIEDTENYIFNTIEDALAIAVKNDLVYVYEGTYLEQGLQFSDGVKMIGVGNVIIQGELPEDSTTELIDATSTIDMFDSGYLENLTITAKNMRYPIHADFSQGLSTKTIINCDFIHYGNVDAWQYRTDNGWTTPNAPSEVFRGCSAWGAGTEAGDKVFIDGCRFESGVRAFSTHNNVNFNLEYGASFVKVSNSEMISHGIDFDGTNMPLLISVHVQNLQSNSLDEVIFDNCKINGYLNNQNSGATEFHKVICNNTELKQTWNDGGSSKSMNYQWQNLDVNWYIYLTDEINAFKNVSGVTLLRGQAVKKSGLGIDLFTSADDVSEFFGILMQDAESQKAGDVKFKGYLPWKYFDNPNYTIADGSDISVDVNGNFIANSSHVVCVASDNNNILID